MKYESQTVTALGVQKSTLNLKEPSFLGIKMIRLALLTLTGSITSLWSIFYTLFAAHCLAFRTVRYRAHWTTHTRLEVSRTQCFAVFMQVCYSSHTLSKSDSTLTNFFSYAWYLSAIKFSLSQFFVSLFLIFVSRRNKYLKQRTRRRGRCGRWFADS